MTDTDSGEPNADEFDEALAEAISANQSEETVIANARLVATYYITLTERGIPDEYATELTCQWVAMMHDTE